MSAIAVLLVFCGLDFGAFMAPGKPIVLAEAKVAEHSHENLSYADAYALSLKTNKPLVIWVGGDFCHRCVMESHEEFIHCFVDKLDGATAPSLVVSVPNEAKTELLRVADITQWVEGDAEHGHVPTTRRAIQRYRSMGIVTDQRGTVTRYRSYPMSFPAMGGMRMRGGRR